MQLSIAFSEDGTALYAQYAGQTGTLPLRWRSEEMQNEGAYPVTIETYDEMLDGEVNGTYTLTHSGIWDYAEYTRGKDGKVFSFTIDHDSTVENGGYRTTPCY